MRTVYVNGRYVPESEGVVSVFDRGFTMSDSVYEVTGIVAGKMLDFDAHMARLQRSMGELGMPKGPSHDELKAIHLKMVELNKLTEGLVYLQITRGLQDRNFELPSGDNPLTVVLFTQARPVMESPLAAHGIKVISLPDLRWHRSDIKTTQLLYACLAKDAAKKKGCEDAWLVRDGLVTEGSANNAFIVTRDGLVVTRDLSTELLPGITRKRIVELSAAHGYRLEQRGFSIAEAKGAIEAFITSATQFVMPVVEIDGARIGEGKPGKFSVALRKLYIDDALARAGVTKVQA
jgi:D-alanine transaminase